MIERSDCGSGGCVTCPFSYNEEAERAQNYGCLPDKFDIVKMKEKSGHNWACHHDDEVLLRGYAPYMTEAVRVLLGYESDDDTHDEEVLAYFQRGEKLSKSKHLKQNSDN